MNKYTIKQINVYMIININNSNKQNIQKNNKQTENITTFFNKNIKITHLLYIYNLFKSKLILYHASLRMVSIMPILLQYKFIILDHFHLSIIWNFLFYYL